MKKLTKKIKSTFVFSETQLIVQQVYTQHTMLNNFQASNASNVLIWLLLALCKIVKHLTFSEKWLLLFMCRAKLDRLGYSLR